MGEKAWVGFALRGKPIKDWPHGIELADTKIFSPQVRCES